MSSKEVNPLVVQVMKEKEIDISQNKPELINTIKWCKKQIL